MLQYLSMCQDVPSEDSAQINRNSPRVFGLGRLGLLGGGLLSSAMGGFHFFLPYLFGWGPQLGNVPPEIRWGTFAINFFMSYLMLAGGVLTLVSCWCWRENEPVTRDLGIVVVMGSFWVMNLIYQLAFPFPVHPTLWWVRALLIVFALVTALSYGLPFARVALRIPSKHPSAETVTPSV